MQKALHFAVPFSAGIGALFQFSIYSVSYTHLALVNFFASGNRVLILYVPKTRGTYSGGYCYDYLSVTAMTLTFTYEYLQSSGRMASSSVAAGSAAKLNLSLIHILKECADSSREWDSKMERLLHLLT